MDDRETVKAKLGQCRSLDEVDGFLEQLTAQKHDTPANRNLVELRRAELRAGNTPRKG